MLRKLIAIAITGGLAKKAWDKYQDRNAERAIADGWKAADAAAESEAPKAKGTRRKSAPRAKKSDAPKA